MNKIIDRNGRLFGLISILDVGVILLVVILALALGRKSQLPQTAAPTASTPITFIARAEGIPDYVAQSIAVGDLVYDKDQTTGGTVGVITAVEILPGSRNMQLTNGTMASVAIEEYSNVLMTIEGSGLVVDGRYKINRIYEVGVNASRNFYTKYALFQVSITAMR